MGEVSHRLRSKSTGHHGSIGKDVDQSRQFLTRKPLTGSRFDQLIQQHTIGSTHHELESPPIATASTSRGRRNDSLDVLVVDGMISKSLGSFSEEDGLNGDPREKSYTVLRAPVPNLAHISSTTTADVNVQSQLKSIPSSEAEQLP
jgi:hypothetical protein